MTIVELNKSCDSSSNKHLTIYSRYSSAPTSTSLDARSQIEVTANLIISSSERMVYEILLDPEVAASILEKFSRKLVATREMNMLGSPVMEMNRCTSNKVKMFMSL